MRPPLIVPETKYAGDLLEDMQSNHCHVAILLDEYGGTAGMVTLGDLLEALVGRIDDAPPAANSVSSNGRVEADGSVLLDGLMRLEEFEEASDVRFDEEQSHDRVETLGGLIAAKLGRIPEVGEQVTIGSRTLRVEALDGRRVARVRLRQPVDDTAPTTASKNPRR